MPAVLHLKTDRENMTNVTRNSISINVTFDLEAAPDCALIKLHFTGEGMTLEDAVATAQRKVAEATSALKANHSSIESIHVVDVYVGQKADRIRSEAQAFPRPLVVQGVLIVTSPADTSAHYRIVDDGVKRGALLENPQRPSYLADMLDSAILYGLVASEKYESMAIEGCLKQAAERGRSIATCAGKKLGELISVSNGIVEPSVGEPVRKDYSYVCKSLPTKFLSPTPQKVILSAKLTVAFEMAD
jgi:uncharacterized protein YggE